MNMDFAMCLLFLVNLFDFQMVVLNYGLIYPLFVVVVRRSFDFNFEVWILGKEDAVQEFGA